MIFAERSNTALRLTEEVNKNGFVAGATLSASMYDGAAAAGFEWMNMSTGVWQAAEHQLAMNEYATGRFEITVDISAVAAASNSIVAMFEITAGGTGGASAKEIVLGTEVYDIANATDQNAILTDTGTDIPARFTGIEGATFATGTDSLEAVRDRGDVAWITGAGGSPITQQQVRDSMKLAPTAGVPAAGSVDEHLDIIDADTTDMQPRVAAIEVDTGTDIPLRFTGVEGAGFLTATDSLEAVRDRGDVAWLTGAGGSPITAQEVRDAMKLTPTAGAPSAGSLDEHMDTIESDTADMQPRIVAVEIDTGTDIPARFTGVEGATFSGITDSLEAIRDRGDVAWLTGAGGSPITSQQVRDAMKLAPSVGVPATGSVDEHLDIIDADTSDMQPRVAAVEVDTGTDIPARLVGIEGAGFLTATDSLEAVRNRGDVAWLTGAGGAPMTAQQVRDAMRLGSAAPVIAGSIDDRFTDVDTPLALKSSQASVDVIDAIVDAILADTTVGGPGPWTTGSGGTPLTAQEIRDAMKLAPSVGIPAAGSVDQRFTDVDSAVAVVDGVVDLVLLDTNDIRTKVTAGVTAWATAVGFATEVKQDVIDGVVDAILVQTTDMQPKVAAGVAAWATATGFATPGDDMALTAAAQSALVDLAWEEPQSDHVAANTMGGSLNASGGSITATAIAQAVWNALKVTYNLPDSMGEAMNDASGPAGILAAINEAVATLIAALSPTQESLTKGSVIPNVFVGHKGDQLICPVYRNGTLMLDTELAGATGLAMNINNTTTALEVDITVGVAVGSNGTIVYTTVVADTIFETAGVWVYQATGTTAAGDVFVSQRLVLQVLEPAA